ncbi:MAG: hypothetical protein HYV02_07340, partial [Deltaproteobacteria bacterium]|nr:hypothetical protein [Deltaproteobacteria bacterium]
MDRTRPTAGVALSGALGAACGGDAPSGAAPGAGALPPTASESASLTESADDLSLSAFLQSPAYSGTLMVR